MKNILSHIQSRAINKMVIGKRYSSYSLGERISTLDALYDRGLVKRIVPPAAGFSPTTMIDYIRIK